MAIPSIMNIGHTGLKAAKAGIATTGHNISNANTEGFSRQRVLTAANDPGAKLLGKNVIGTGTTISRVERINDEYIEKQVRNAHRDMSHYEEKDAVLRQIEDIFNEMNGEGLNRLVSGFFNQFRKLSEEPESPALRQTLREATQSMVNDFHRLRKEVVSVREHIDSRLENSVAEINSLSKELTELNDKIRLMETSGGSPNDLLDKRDIALKKLGSYFDISMYKDKKGNFNVDMKGVGPLLTGSVFETLGVERSPADDNGKPDGAFDVTSSGSAQNAITHSLKGGKLGALLDARDRVVSTVLDHLDEMAFALTEAVNDIHSQGVTANGESGILFFQPMQERERAAEFISLSADIQNSTDNIATGAVEDSPGDNRIAIAISQLQNEKFMDDGNATLDQFYDSVVADIGIANARNRSALVQEKEVVTQLNKIRDQISGVSIDEETANLLQFQHAFDASAKVIQVADELFKTVLSIHRD